MLPRLQAEERIGGMNDMACVMGGLAPAEMSKHRRMLDRAAAGEQGAGQSHANPGQLASAGIGLRVASEAAEGPLNEGDDEGRSHE